MDVKIDIPPVASGRLRSATARCQRELELAAPVRPTPTISMLPSLPRLLLPLLVGSLLANAAPPAFVNTAVVRTVDLGGATTQVTTTFTAKALVDGATEYLLALGKEDDARLGWLEVREKKGKTTGDDLSWSKGDYDELR